MRAGLLRYSISIYSLEKAKDELGSTVTNRVLYKTVRAERKIVNGSESEKDSQLTAIQQVVFRLRYDSGIDETMVVEFEGKFYNILYINLPNKYFVTELTCTRLKK